MFDVNNNCSATYLCSHSFISCFERSKQQANIINLFYRKSHWIVIWILFCYDFNVITMRYVHACIKHIVNNCSATYLWSHSFHYCNCNLVRSPTWCLMLDACSCSQSVWLNWLHILHILHMKCHRQSKYENMIILWPSV